MMTVNTIVICLFCLQVNTIIVYSITSMARTWMARLPWMIQTRFSVPTKSFQSSENKYLRTFFPYFIMELYVVCTH